MTSVPRQLPKYCIVIFSLNIDISAYVWIYFHCNSPRSKIPERGVESPQKLRATRFSKIGKNSERPGMQESTNLCALMVPYLKYFLSKADLAQKAYGYLTDKEQSKFLKCLQWRKEQHCALSPTLLLPICAFLTAFSTCPPS